MKAALGAAAYLVGGEFVIGFIEAKDEPLSDFQALLVVLFGIPVTLLLLARLVGEVLRRATR